MKLLNLTLIFTLTLITLGCGVEAEKKDPNRSFIERRNFLNLASIEDIEIDNNIRSTTMLIYPQAADLEGFEFNSATEQSWKGLKEILSYGDKIQTTIPRGKSSFEKSTQIIYTIISAGQARDDAFLAMKIAEEQLANLVIERKKQLEEVDIILDEAAKVIKKKKCYYKVKPAEGEQYICKLKKSGKYKKRKKGRSCEDFKEFNFIETTDEQQEEIEGLITKCTFAIEAEELIKNGPIKDKIANAQTIQTKNSQYRDDGKQVVIDLLEAVETHNPNVFLTTGAENEKSNDTGPYSRINFNRTEFGVAVNELSLRLDFGNNYSEGAGFQEYSLDNGKITDVNYYQKSSLETVLEFKINTKDFVIEAELFESVQGYHGLRFVGDLIIRYPNNTVREGVGKIELSLKN